MKSTEEVREQWQDAKTAQGPILPREGTDGVGDRKSTHSGNPGWEAGTVGPWACTVPWTLALGSAEAVPTNPFPHCPPKSLARAFL